MHFGIIDSLFNNPRATLIALLLALPGRMLAISAHEAAHGWMAERCGDSTARLMGRVTLNPLRHLDPVGVVCFLVLGIGWAKPVPVNPYNYRNGRRDDLKVAMAGIVMNLILFLSGLAVLYGISVVALTRVPTMAEASAGAALYRSTVWGASALVTTNGWYRAIDLLSNVPYLSEVLIAPVFGRVFGHLYTMIGYLVSTNLMLALFNLLPVPPLDGYHLFNDLILKGRFFAQPKTQRICVAALYLGIFTGAVSTVLSTVYDFVLSGFGHAVLSLLQSGGMFP